ncbi:uncharacterized protein LOC125244422 [Megalobrama amblycephala]|uniref:uncharacterized protein LOC125244422 n=1 Tax=Megalobrama amblycephala TaxID=75352 RepID=UPI002013F670|nr:uncharacterized protein LOC125244422 [Megalobrama amblycephala]
MASAGLLFLMLISSSFLISTVSTSANQDQRQKNSSKKLEKVKYIVKNILLIIEKITRAVSPFMALLPAHGTLASGILNAIGMEASKINSQLNGDPLQAFMNEFNNLNIKLDQYHGEQKWDIWANTYYKPELKINTAWTMFNTMLRSVSEAKDVKEKERHEQEFVNTYSKFEHATKTLHSNLINDGPSLGPRFGDLLAKHVKCHEKNIIEYTVLIYKLLYKGNIMNNFYYKLRKVESQARVDEEANITYDTASIMFQTHKECIINSMEYIKNDVRTLIDKTQARSELAKNVRSFLVKEYDKYDWMVVAFITKKSNKPFDALNSHVLTGFTEVTKDGISVAVARQVKGTYTKADLVKQAIGRCIDNSVQCHEVAKKLEGCTETMEGIRVSKTYTAVHAYIKKAHDSTSKATDEDIEVSADPEDSSAQTPFIYKGKCKKHLVLKSKFVVMIKSDEEIMTENPCSKLNCGGEERGKCVKVEGIFLAMCECKMPYYGENCENDIDQYKRELDIQVNRKKPQVADKRRRPRQ